MKELFEALIIGLVMAVTALLSITFIVGLIIVVVVIGVPLTIISMLILVLCSIVDYIQDVLRK